MRISIRSITKIGVLACLTYVMWYKWVYGDQISLLYTIAAISIGSAVIGLGLERISLGKVFPFTCFNDVIMCVYSLLFGMFVATSPSVLVSTIFTYLAFSLVCLAACYASWKDGFDWLLIGLIGIAILCSIWTLTRGYERVGYGLVLSATNNPHTLGFVMNLGLFAVAYRSKNTTKSFFWNLLLIALFVYVIVQCGSRKCLLAAVFVVIPWLWVEIKSIYKNGTAGQRIVANILVVLIVIGVAYFFKEIYINSKSYDRMINIEESNANKARLFYFKLGFELFLDSPVFGIGLGQFALLNPDLTYSHSVISEAVASWGLIGSMMYFIPIIAVCRRAFHIAKAKRDKESIMIASLCAMELFMAFLQIYFYLLPHMIAWAIIALFVKNNSEKKIT